VADQPAPVSSASLSIARHGYVVSGFPVRGSGGGREGGSRTGGEGGVGCVRLDYDGVVLTPRFSDAFSYALRAHAGQTKKGTAIPYIAHLMDVTALVLMHGGNEDEAVGALLHDAAEDAGGRPRLDDIRQRFGDAVADIVEDCSDTLETPKPPWLQRKTAYIEHLPQVSASTRLVSAADKTANVRTIVADFKSIGGKVFERFAGRTHGTLWYYRTLADIFLRLGPVALARQLDDTVRELQRLTGIEGGIARPDPTCRT